MKRLRSHIAQGLVALLICTGLSLSWVQPVQAGRTSYAFARWLSTMTHSADGSEVHKQLQELQASGIHLDTMLEKASKIVTAHNEEFNFPFAKEYPSQQLYQLLLIEWNQYQTGNAMANIPLQQSVKPLLPLHVDKKEGGTFAVQPVHRVFISKYVDFRPSAPSKSTPTALSPMSGGIAIGAP